MAAVVIALSTALVAEPALSRVDPVRTSGPVGDRDHDVGEPRAGRGRGRRSRARCARPSRRAAASAPRTNGVTELTRRSRSAGRRVAARAPSRRPSSSRSSAPFDGAEHRALAAGHDAADAVGIAAEGGRALRRLEHSQPPAGARAQEARSARPDSSAFAARIAARGDRGALARGGRRWRAGPRRAAARPRARWAAVEPPAARVAALGGQAAPTGRLRRGLRGSARHLVVRARRRRPRATTAPRRGSGPRGRASRPGPRPRRARTSAPLAA